MIWPRVRPAAVRRGAAPPRCCALPALDARAARRVEARLLRRAAADRLLLEIGAAALVLAGPRLHRGSTSRRTGSCVLALAGPSPRGSRGADRLAISTAMAPPSPPAPCSSCSTSPTWAATSCSRAACCRRCRSCCSRWKGSCCGCPAARRARGDPRLRRRRGAALSRARRPRAARAASPTSAASTRRARSRRAALQGRTAARGARRHGCARRLRGRHVRLRLLQRAALAGRDDRAHALLAGEAAPRRSAGVPGTRSRRRRRGSPSRACTSW